MTEAILLKESKELKDYVEDGMSYTEYLDLVDSLLAEEKTTGPKQTPELVEFTKLNRQRMKRNVRTFRADEDLLKTVSNLDRELIWLVITEGWCGDAAQSVPVVESVAQLSDKIETKYLLRDENLELMDQFLTNGARAIPKLIMIDRESNEVCGHWGARPARAQEMFMELREQGIDKSEIQEQLQRWYNSDKQVSIKNELRELIKACASG